MKPARTWRRSGGYYRLLWTEYSRKIPFTWHRTRRGAETIPKANRYPDEGGNVGRDYYHQLCVGADGLAAFAKEAEMRIDWQEADLVSTAELTRHLCPPDVAERAMAEVLAEMDGKLSKTQIKDRRWRCSLCNEPWPLTGTSRD